jgi:hypothetical protein
MHGPINVKSPNNTSKWQMRFNSAFKELKCPHAYNAMVWTDGIPLCSEVNGMNPYQYTVNLLQYMTNLLIKKALYVGRGISYVFVKVNFNNCLYFVTLRGLYG